MFRGKKVSEKENDDFKENKNFLLNNIIIRKRSLLECFQIFVVTVRLMAFLINLPR